MAKNDFFSFQGAMMAISEGNQKSSLNDDELEKVFNEIDDDGNGYITPREAKKAFKKLAEKFNINRVSSLANCIFMYRFVFLNVEILGLQKQNVIFIPLTQFWLFSKSSFSAINF